MEKETLLVKALNVENGNHGKVEGILVRLENGNFASLKGSSSIDCSTNVGEIFLVKSQPPMHSIEYSTLRNHIKYCNEIVGGSLKTQASGLSSS